jgi:chemotaxis protein methyltransferase CheR
MTPREFNFLCALLKERSGLNLSADTRELLEVRLQPLFREGAFPSSAALVHALQRPEAEALRARLAEAVTVQESYFFRDKTPFRYFADVMLPRLMRAREDSRRIKVWCAAAATGQEPYSLAMLLAARQRELANWTVEILATDFARDALRKARAGVYSQFEVQRGLPVALLVKHFSKTGKAWELNPEIRGRVKFRPHNLIEDVKLGVFDVIFCRNVLIYFDEETKRQVLARLASQLARDGYLVLGASETTRGASNAFMAAGEDQHGIFRLDPAATKTVAAA